jgi:hypothetical protein
VASPPSAVAIALRATGLCAVVLLALLLTGSLRLVDLLSPALEGQGSDVIVEDFGRDGIRAEEPFDGQYIYVTARLLPDIDAITERIYESDYRLVRILHPLLASPAPPGDAMVVVLELWNLLGVGLFVWAMADVLQRYGHPPGWAMAGAAACALSLVATTSEPLAFGLALAGLNLVDRERLVAGTALMALGGLTRESALTFAAAAAVLLLVRRRPVPAVGCFVAAVLPTAVWWVYVQTVTERSRTPISPLGIVHLVGQPAVNVIASIVALGLIAVSVVAWWDVPPLRWLTLAFAAWIPIYERFAFEIGGIPRLSFPSVALGIAGILRWRSRSSPGGAGAAEQTADLAG